jgi:hypothetical protein
MLKRKPWRRGGSKWSHGGCVLCIPMITDLHHLYEQQDPNLEPHQSERPDLDQHQRERSDPDSHQSERSDPDPH